MYRVYGITIAVKDKKLNCRYSRAKKRYTKSLLRGKNSITLFYLSLSRLEGAEQKDCTERKAYAAKNTLDMILCAKS
jgi:hypothetical protein